MTRLRLSTLTGGLCVVVLGIWMLMRGADLVGMSLAAVGPALLATIGLVLLVSGLTRRE